MNGVVPLTFPRGGTIAGLVLFIVAACGRVQTQDYEIDAMFEQMRQQQFDEGVRTGNTTLIELSGGTIHDDRVFRPGEDIIGTLDAEYRAVMERLDGPRNVPPSWLGGSSYRSGPPQWVLSEEARTAAVAEVKGFVDRAKELSERRGSDDVRVKDVPGTDYLPSITGLLGHTFAQQPSVASADPPVEASGKESLLSLAEWLQSSDENDSGAISVFGFIEPSATHGFRFVDESGEQLSIRGLDSLLVPKTVGNAEELRGDGCNLITVQLPQKAIAALGTAITGVIQDVRVADDVRGGTSAPFASPTAAYRWIFGQLVNGKGAPYVPFKEGCPLAPQARLAVCGKARWDGKKRFIEARRLLISSTPLASQARFIFEWKGVPAALIDSAGVHNTVFLQCPVFCRDKNRWLAERPALKSVSMEPERYLRAMLVASPLAIDSMNAQIRDEIHATTVVAMEEVLSEAAVARGLRAAGLEAKKIEPHTRLFVNGLGRKIVDRSVALAAGETVPVEGIRKLAEERARFLKLAKEPQVAVFVNNKVIESFLILAVDQNGVSLCDFRALLDVHARYAFLAEPSAADDYLVQACRFAEIGRWLNELKGGAHVPFKPPFSPLPATTVAKQRFLEELTGLGGEQKIGGGVELDGGEGDEGAGGAGFTFPGE